MESGEHITGTICWPMPAHTLYRWYFVYVAKVQINGRLTEHKSHLTSNSISDDDATYTELMGKFRLYQKVYIYNVKHKNGIKIIFKLFIYNCCYLKNI